jgi:curved DNA-binding protein CbpA
MLAKTLYDLLNVSPTATRTQIRKAYYELARRHHPDLRSGDEAVLRDVIAAYAVLSNGERRRQYDRELAAQPTAPSSTTSTRPPGGAPMSERERAVDLGEIVPPPTFSQLGILVLDGSGSMERQAAGKITKAQTVNLAVREMLTRFSVSRYQRNFSFSVVTFDGKARRHTAVTPAPAVDDNADYDPLRNHGGGTNIGAGLREAGQIAQEFLRDAPQDLPASVVIVVMSDGRDGEGGAGDPAETLRVADEIKRNKAITLCSTYFAEIGTSDTDAQNHLRAIASNPATGYKTVYDADTLRKFFIASVSTGTSLAIV